MKESLSWVIRYRRPLSTQWPALWRHSFSSAWLAWNPGWVDPKVACGTWSHLRMEKFRKGPSSGMPVSSVAMISSLKFFRDYSTGILCFYFSNIRCSPCQKVYLWLPPWELEDLDIFSHSKEGARIKDCYECVRMIWGVRPTQTISAKDGERFGFALDFWCGSLLWLCTVSRFALLKYPVIAQWVSCRF